MFPKNECTENTDNKYAESIRDASYLNPSPSFFVPRGTSEIEIPAFPHISPYFTGAED